MCGGCWLQGGAPRVNTPGVHAAADAIGKLLDHPVAAATGMALYTVLDNWNFETSHLIEARAKIGSLEEPADLILLERLCFDALLPLTPTDRLSARALEAGLWTPDEQPT